MACSALVLALVVQCRLHYQRQLVAQRAFVVTWVSKLEFWLSAVQFSVLREDITAFRGLCHVPP